MSFGLHALSIILSLYQSCGAGTDIFQVGKLRTKGLVYRGQDHPDNIEAWHQIQVCLTFKAFVLSFSIWGRGERRTLPSHFGENYLGLA